MFDEDCVGSAVQSRNSALPSYRIVSVADVAVFEGEKNEMF